MIWWMLRWLHSFSQTNEWARWLCQYANKINKDVCSHSNWTSLFPIYLLVFCWMHSFHIDRVLTRVYMQVSSILGTRVIFYGSFDLWLINVCRVGWMLVIILHWKMHFFDENCDGPQFIHLCHIFAYRSLFLFELIMHSSTFTSIIISRTLIRTYVLQ